MKKPISLQLRVTLLAASSVGLVVALLTIAVYFVVSRELYDNVAAKLERQGQALASSEVATEFALNSRPILVALKSLNPDIDAMLVTPAGQKISTGKPIELFEEEYQVIRGEAFSFSSERADTQVFSIATIDGSTLILSQDLSDTRTLLNRLAIVLVVGGFIGVYLALIAGAAVGRSGISPVLALTKEVERVARTDELRPIEVVGDDEIARLTVGVNSMLQALSESRDRQSRLVADAGHELKTPLTSMRTNIELLIAASKPGAATISTEDREALQQDVIAQLEELSRLVGDLVDLARDDQAVAPVEVVAMHEVIDECVIRVKRRRLDVQFNVDTTTWYLAGEHAGLGRALVNLLDNAAKWSPNDSSIEIVLRPQPPLPGSSEQHAELLVSDHGSGIAADERELVFERFYRATDSRSMPGSGLGLAIVWQVVQRHGGSIEVLETAGGGTTMRVLLPGSHDITPQLQQLVGKDALFSEDILR